MFNSEIFFPPSPMYRLKDKADRTTQLHVPFEWVWGKEENSIRTRRWGGHL